MRWRAAVGALALGAASVSAQDQPLSPAQSRELEAASAAAARSDCAGVLQHGVPLTQATPPLAEGLRTRLYDVATWCAFSTGQPALGYRLALRGTALTDASDLQWRLRLGAELDERHDDDALTTTLLMTRGRGAALNSIPVSWFSALHRHLVVAHQGEADSRLLTVLTETYSPDELLADLSFFRLDRARQLVATDPVKAKALLADLDLPPAIEEAVLDPTLRGLFPSNRMFA